ncbi:MAG: hypothetical protein JXR22_10675 [Prolixibacteraceae bacterium]|nr:hypothetical protein [Prolixibacteraceae bacterium]
MKTITNLTRKIMLSLATGLMLFVFSACATKVIFLSSAVVPAAQGTVTIKEDGNKNYFIKIQTKNLADSQKLTPPKNVYVVWLVTDNNSTKNIGQIISTSGSMSTKLKSSFETVSSFRPNKIFITAENEADISYPYSEVVLTTDFISLKN